MQHPDLQQLRRFTLAPKMHMNYTDATKREPDSACNNMEIRMVHI